MPITACGLRQDDEAVRTTVALRLDTTLCVRHTCPCGAQVDTYGVHSLVCKWASAKITRHQALNDVIARAFVNAEMLRLQRAERSLNIRQQKTGWFNSLARG